jgi:hypothetical protein
VIRSFKRVCDTAHYHIFRGTENKKELPRAGRLVGQAQRTDQMLDEAARLLGCIQRWLDSQEAAHFPSRARRCDPAIHALRAFLMFLPDIF